MADGIEVVLGIIGGIVVWRRGWRWGELFLIVMMSIVAASQTVLHVEGAASIDP